MVGYYKDADATRTAIDADGWLHTGDLGRFDAEGFLYLTGRSKNVILSGKGQNIYPEEIEAKLNNLECVGESLVLEDDGKIVALVYPDMDLVDERYINESHLAELMEENRRQLNAMLPAYSAVSRVKLVFEEFEKTPTKKIKRRLYEALR
jgi:long-chain acyl-CoA synthetase